MVRCPLLRRHGLVGAVVEVVHLKKGEEEAVVHLRMEGEEAVARLRMEGEEVAVRRRMGEEVVAGQLTTEEAEEEVPHRLGLAVQVLRLVVAEVALAVGDSRH